MKRSGRNFGVLIVAPTKDNRQKLVSYYSKKIERDYTRPANSIIRRAEDIARAIKIINDEGFSPDLIILSEGFPESERQKLKSLLNSLDQAPDIFTISTELIEPPLRVA